MYHIVHLMEANRPIDEIEEFLGKIDDINSTTEYGENILHLMIRKNIQSLDYFRQLSLRKFDFNAPNDAGETPLISAARRDNTAICFWLLDEPSVEVNHSDEQQDTALLWAAHNDNLLLVTRLMERGASLDHVYKDGKNAIMWAAFKHNYEIVRYLLQHLRNHNHEDKYGANLLSLLGCRNYKFILSEWVVRNKMSLVIYFFQKKTPIEKNLLHKIFSYYTE